MVLNFVVNGHHSFGDIFFKINWKSEIKCSTNEVPNETFVEFQLMKTKFPLELFPTERKKELNKINDKNSNAKNKHYKIKTCSSVPVIWNISLCRKNLLVVLLFWINYTHIWMKWNWENIDFAASNFGITFKRIIVNLFDKFCLIKIFVKERSSKGRWKAHCLWKYLDWIFYY